jgi:hypothetical protein
MNLKCEKFLIYETEGSSYNVRKMLTCASKAHVKDAKIEIFS